MLNKPKNLTSNLNMVKKKKKSKKPRMQYIYINCNSEKHTLNPKTSPLSYDYGERPQWLRIQDIFHKQITQPTSHLEPLIKNII